MKTCRTTLFVLGAVTVFSGCPTSSSTTGSTPPPPPHVLGASAFRLAVDADGSRVVLQRNGEGLLVLDRDAFQLGTVLQLQADLSYDPYWLEKTDDPLNEGPPLDLRWETVTGWEVRSAQPDVVVVGLVFTDGTRTEVTFTTGGDGRFRADWVPVETVADSVIAWMRLRARASTTEGFYGLGEWPDDVDHRGHMRPMQMEVDTSIESFNNENHVPVPLLIGTRGWGVFVESTRLGLFDVARKEDDLVEVTYGTAERSADGLRFHLFAAEHPLDITAHYYALTTPPLLPAPWALGPWIWRDENRDQAQVLDDIAQIRTLDLATSGIWIDRPYASAVNTFDFRAAQFPDPPAMIARAHAAGLRMALWHVPYLEAGAEPFTTEATAAGYFPPTTGALLNGWGKPLDFTNPDAMAWWQERVRRYTSLGIEGFKLDYAEDVIPSLYTSRGAWRFADGSDERVMHHRYQLLYHRAYAETLPTDGGFLLCRAGRWGDQAHVSVIWPGDLDATFTRHRERFTTTGGDNVTGVGGLPASIVMGLSLGPSGFPFFGADTGGYRHSPPRKELFIRWAQQTALSSVMQVGDSSSQPPWEFTTDNGRDQEALDIYRVYARLHLRLFPYEWTLARAIASSGHPITRPLGLQFPGLGAHPSDEYMFGPDLLVAPVIEDGARTRPVIVPPGKWVSWWDGSELDGGDAGGATVTVEAPLDRLPLYARRGAVVPLLRPTIDTLSPATDPEVDSFARTAGPLWVRVVTGGTAPTSFTVYDGTVLAAESTADAERVSITPGTIFTAGAVFELVGAGSPGGFTPSAVTLDGAALEEVADAAALGAAPQGWLPGPDAGGMLQVKVPPGTHQVVVTR